MKRSDSIFLKHTTRSNEAGMNLLEIIIVIALIGTIMSIVVSNLTSTQDNAMIKAAKIAMGQVQQKLQLYRLDVHSYPSTEQGLEALVTNPGVPKWRGPYIEEQKLNDPWGRPFRYEKSGKKLNIISDGPEEDDDSDDIYLNEPKDKEQ